MAQTKIGVREFRERLASVLESETPVAITRNGETVGYYIPARRKPTDEDRVTLREAAAKFRALMASHGVTEEELIADFEKARKRRR